MALLGGCCSGPPPILASTTLNVYRVLYALVPPNTADDTDAPFPLPAGANPAFRLNHDRSTTLYRTIDIAWTNPQSTFAGSTVENLRGHLSVSGTLQSLPVGTQTYTILGVGSQTDNGFPIGMFIPFEYQPPFGLADTTVSYSDALIQSAFEDFVNDTANDVANLRTGAITGSDVLATPGTGGPADGSVVVWGYNDFPWANQAYPDSSHPFILAPGTIGYDFSGLDMTLFNGGLRENGSLDANVSFASGGFPLDGSTPPIMGQTLVNACSYTCILVNAEFGSNMIGYAHSRIATLNNYILVTWIVTTVDMTGVTGWQNVGAGTTDWPVAGWVKDILAADYSAPTPDPHRGDGRGYVWIPVPGPENGFTNAPYVIGADGSTATDLWDNSDATSFPGVYMLITTFIDNTTVATWTAASKPWPAGIL